MAALEAVFAQVPDFVARINSSPVFADEVRQALRQRLLIGEGRAPRIAEYTGRGPLGAWVRVAAVRVALNLRTANKERPSRDGEVARRAVGEALDPEMQVIKEHSRKEFEQALKEALATLAVDERNVLRLHLLDRLSIDKIAALHRVHRATAARWLQGARESILEGTKARLRERLKLTSNEFESLSGLVRSQLEVSLRSQLLRSRR
jgi:RNA polymerase sigma-70 factor (ECF subfamily)